jgi:2-amino-4-hydroxy-6-hydroxymethyldihydropteridine diphosphokinase
MQLDTRVVQMANTTVYLSLGGNEGKVFQNLQKALSLLSAESAIGSLKVSRFYQTAPLNVKSPHWFINAVCSFQTALSLNALFKITQAIEIRLGKVPKPKDAPRPIDIDLLFYGDQYLREGGLEIPHPRWKERLFVLVPLVELTPEIILQSPLGIERYVLNDLIQPLLANPLQAISLLEKNPDLQ